MLRTGQVQFVVANVGDKLRWIDASECYNFWKEELETHFAENITRFYPDEFPGEYAYLASEWRGEIQMPIILLEKYH